MQPDSIFRVSLFAEVGSEAVEPPSSAKRASKFLLALALSGAFAVPRPSSRTEAVGGRTRPRNAEFSSKLGREETTSGKKEKTPRQR